MLNRIAHLTVTAVQSVVSPALGTGKHEEGAGVVQDRQDQAHLRAKKGLALGSSAWAANKAIWLPAMLNIPCSC